MIDDACGVITKPLFEESAKAVTARSISTASRKSRGFASTLSAEATAWITPNRATPEGVAASRRTATRLMPGANAGAVFERGKAGGVAAGSRQTGNKSSPDGISYNREHNRYGAGHLEQRPHS